MNHHTSEETGGNSSHHGSHGGFGGGEDNESKTNPFYSYMKQYMDFNTHVMGMFMQLFSIQLDNYNTFLNSYRGGEKRRSGENKEHGV